MIAIESLRKRIETLEVKCYLFKTCKMELFAVGSKFDIGIWAAKIKQYGLFQMVEYCKQNYVVARFYCDKGSWYDKLFCFIINRRLKRAKRLMNQYLIEAITYITKWEDYLEMEEDETEEILLFTEAVIKETELQITRNYEE